MTAAGAAPAPEKAVETKDQTTETAQPQAQPTTLRERIIHRLHEIFAGREEYAGWRQ